VTLLRSPLLHFLFAGAALFLIEAAWSRTPRPAVVEVNRSAIEERLAAYQLQLGRSPTPEETRSVTERVIDEAIWLEQAFALGLHEQDAIVQQRLLRNMRFLEGDAAASEAELLARARELGMDRSDRVVQRRLIDQVKAILRAGVRAEPPSREELEAYYAAHAERWREPPLLDLSHVYFSRDRRGDRAEADARTLRARLRSESLEATAAIELGDAFLAGHSLRGASPTRIAARLGSSFAAGVEEAPTGVWTGPIESAFGSHLVWIEAREPSRIPPLEEIETRVFEDWADEETRNAFRSHLDHRRDLVEIRIVEDTDDTVDVDDTTDIEDASG
jgi:hypothetical protein